MNGDNKQNVVVCGYPKSGTTWSTRLVAQLLNCPSSGYWGFEGDTFVTEGTDRKSDMVCYQSHHKLTDLRNSKKYIAKIIYVVRDPRDIVVSGIFHFNFYSRWLEKAIKKRLFPESVSSILKKINNKTHSKQFRIDRMFRMLCQGDEFIDHCHWGWNDHVLPYINDKEVLVVRYEDLLLDGLNTAKKILEYGGVNKADKQIINDLESQSFKARKSEFRTENEKVKDKHLRKGIVGDWKMHLSEQDNSYVISKQGEAMKQLGYI